VYIILTKDELIFKRDIFLITGTAKQVTVLKYPCTALPRCRSYNIDRSRDYTFSFTRKSKQT